MTAYAQRQGPFTKATGKGAPPVASLLLPHCIPCDSTFWHPREHCPACHSSQVDWLEPSSPATLHTYTVNPRSGAADGSASGPSAIGLAEFADGLLLLAPLEISIGVLRVGLPIKAEVRVDEARDVPHLVFVPLSEA